MSKIGKKQILIPEGVKVELKNNQIEIEGLLGKIVLDIPKNLDVLIKDQAILVKRKEEDNKHGKMMHGTFHQLIVNAIKGVSEGWKKELVVKGTGFKVGMNNERLVLSLGFSHPVEFSPPPGIKLEVREDKIVVIGINKAEVGNVADRIRKIYPPDPYKGKGIRYVDEKIILKPGKTVKTGVSGGTGK